MKHAVLLTCIWEVPCLKLGQDIILTNIFHAFSHSTQKMGQYPTLVHNYFIPCFFQFSAIQSLGAIQSESVEALLNKLQMEK